MAATRDSTFDWKEKGARVTRAFGIIESAFSDAYKLNDPQTPYFPSDILSRLDAAVDFVKSAIDEIGKLNPLPHPVSLRQRKSNGIRLLKDIYDEIAGLMFELILAASVRNRRAKSLLGHPA